MFTKNYADDIKDVINAVHNRHPGKIKVIAHSLGGHQFLRTLQHYTDWDHHVGAISIVAATVNMGVTRFYATMDQMNPEHHTKDNFY